MTEAHNAQEFRVVSFSWTLNNLKELFEDSRGSEKSSVIKSPLFGDNKWQILFYANSGTSDGSFMSLYLSCEPTEEELQRAINNKWKRDGKYKFVLELKNTNKLATYMSKEANGHAFLAERQNWGWVSFARRDVVYFNNPIVRDQDALVIVCTITSFASPVVPQTIPQRLVPRGLIDTVGSLLNNPSYSDIRFVLPRRHPKGKRRVIYANRKLLERVEYFQIMFGSGFAEGQQDMTVTMDDDMGSDMNDSFCFDDSDEENDFEDDNPVNWPSSDGSYVKLNPTREYNDARALTPPLRDNADQMVVQRSESRQSNVSMHGEAAPDSSRRYANVVVKDVAYSTYLSVLYYIYTDSITFAPLSSSFMAPSQPASPTASTHIAPVEPPANYKSTATGDDGVSKGPSSRREWLAHWRSYNSQLSRPAPCSAKAVFKVADRLGLADLKERAFSHIKDSLTVENIALEVFSEFSATYAEVRQVQTDFFLAKWQDIRSSKVMQNIWTQIRLGRHPGFEQVWPVIAQSLEFRPADTVTNK